MAADGEGTACSKTSDEGRALGAARLARVEGGGIALANQKGLFPYHPPDTVKAFHTDSMWIT